MKRWLYFIIIIFLVCILPLVIAWHVNTIYAENHIKELKGYTSFEVHELYAEKWNYCPNCGEYIGAESEK